MTGERISTGTGVLPPLHDSAYPNDAEPIPVEMAPLVAVLGIEPTLLDQLYRHTSNPRPSPGDDPSTIGDCYRTVIACLLSARNPEWVPHFGAMNLEVNSGWEHYRLARHWLRDEYSLDLATVDIAEADRLGVAYGLSVQSKRGPWHHLVLAQAGQVIHDPSGHPDGYSIDDALDGEPVDILVRPYDPGPDEQVAAWRSER